MGSALSLLPSKLWMRVAMAQQQLVTLPHQVSPGQADAPAVHQQCRLLPGPGCEAGQPCTAHARGPQPREQRTACLPFASHARQLPRPSQQNSHQIFSIFTSKEMRGQKRGGSASLPWNPTTQQALLQEPGGGTGPLGRPCCAAMQMLCLLHVPSCSPGGSAVKHGCFSLTAAAASPEREQDFGHVLMS